MGTNVRNKNTDNVIQDNESNLIRAAILIIEHDGEFLLTKRSDTLRSYPGHWVFPGGKIDENETAREGLIREVLEETNINLSHKIKDLKFISLYTLDEFYIRLYKIDVSSKFRSVIESEMCVTDEVQELGFFHKDELPRTKLLTNRIINQIIKPREGKIVK